MGKTGINYPELGGVHEKKRMYAETEEFRHPSGNWYKRIGGKWVLIEKPRDEGRHE